MSIVPFNEQAVAEGIAGALGADEGQDKPSVVPAADSAAQVAQPAVVDPLAYTLPDSEGIPEKFRNQPLSKVIQSQGEAERVFHENQAKLKSREYELQLANTANEALKAQVEAFRPTAAKPAEPNRWEGLNLAEDVILNPEKVLDRALSIAEQNAEKREKAAAERQRIEGQKRNEEGMALHAAVTAAEAARVQLGKTQEEWMPFVHDLAPAVFQAGRQLDSAAYVEEFNARKSRYGGGQAQTIEVKVQGGAPVVARAAPGASSAAPGKPSPLSERQTEQAQYYADLFGIDKDQYVARVAANLTPKEKV